MALSNREFYQLHALLSAERIEQLLEIEDAARELYEVIESGEPSGRDWQPLIVALDVVPLS